MPTRKKNLVIVESPAKAKTIEKYIERYYHVIASKKDILEIYLSHKWGLILNMIINLNTFPFVVKAKLLKNFKKKS